MFNIVLVHPQIPQNTGSIGRICVNTDSRLHIVKPIGFDMSEKALRRAGLDYWKLLDVTVWESLDDFLNTIEISNTTPLPAKIYANEGIAQVLFLEGDEPCEVTYADKKGKYQSQTGITLPRILR